MTRQVLWSAVLATSSVTTAQPTSIMDLGQVPNWTAARGRAISGNGEFAVGESGDSILGFTVPFLWSAGSGMHQLGPGTGINHPQSISYDGGVVCGFDGARGWRWTPSGVQFISTPVGPAIWNGVSGDGTRLVGMSAVTGWYWTESEGAVGIGDLPGGTTETTPSACSFDGRVIVGVSSGAHGREAFRWTAETGMVGLGQPNGADRSGAACVSADGSVIGGGFTIGARNQAFRWTAATGIVQLGYLSSGDTFSQASAMSADGMVIVGESAGSGPDAVPFVWTAETGMRSLEEILRSGGTALDGWILLSAMGISADGTRITGTARHNGVIAAYIAVIPAPASALVLLGALAIPRRRARV